jgi:predicted tellurium resistance membrane protein TerC
VSALGASRHPSIMVNPKQQVSSRGIRVLGIFVAVYLLVGSYMYFAMDLPTLAYAAYGILSWIGGMVLFYRLHTSFMADFEP